MSNEDGDTKVEQQPYGIVFEDDFVRVENTVGNGWTSDNAVNQELNLSVGDDLEMQVCYPKQLNTSLRNKLYYKARRLVKRLRGDYRPENSNMYKWAKAELDRILVNCEEGDDLDMQMAINREILDIVKVFCDQHHSGSTAWYTLSMIKRLLDWKPITPLTGEEDEWNEGYIIDGVLHQQNKRCSSVFRDNSDNSTAHYIDAKVYSDNGGYSWYHKGGGDRDVISFPFKVPDKPEYIYLNGEDSDEVITDPERIKQIYEAYERQLEID